MENLTVPGAVSALSKAFSDMLSAGCESFAEFGPRALGLARRSAAEAMSVALEAMDAELLHLDFAFERHQRVAVLLQLPEPRWRQRDGLVEFERGVHVHED